MKKKLLRIFLLLCGMNLFTSCYGMPPEDWECMPKPLPVEEAAADVSDDAGTGTDGETEAIF